MRCATIALRRAMLAVVVSVSVSGMLVPQASAATVGSCLKPGVPVCMDDATTFVSADKMSACQFEVKEYVDKTMAYLKCLNDENVGTGQELTRNVERFNCRLSGGRTCQ